MRAQEKKTEFRKQMIKWYRRYGRHDLPWRKTSDPWKILLATLMLRKTTARQTEKIYKKFIERYPNPQSVCSESEKKIRSVIRPLGIEHQRARLIKRLASEIVEKFGGNVPADMRKLKLLKGVGEYTASEVLLVAYGEPRPLLDRNMIRVIERVFGIKSKKARPHTDAQLWKFCKSLLPKDPELAKEFNYGVLDFASSICQITPKCERCPLRLICYYFARRKVGA